MSLKETKLFYTGDLSSSQGQGGWDKGIICAKAGAIAKGTSF